jgi:outer membrane protein TolC
MEIPGHKGHDRRRTRPRRSAVKSRAVPIAAIAACALALAAEPAPAARAGAAGAEPDPAGLPASPPAPAHDDHVTVTPDPALTLRAALDAALERDPGRERLDARDDEAQTLRRVARAWTPEPVALVGSGASDDLAGSHDGYRAWEAGIEIPLWIPGQRAARGRVAEHAQAGALAARAQRALELAGTLRELAAEWTRARARVAVAGHALDAAGALEAALRRAAELGEVADRDRLLAEEEALGRRDALLRAQAELRDSELRWHASTGLDRAPADASEPRAPERPFGPDHPLIAEAEARVARAEAALTQATRDEWATPHLAVASEHERDLRSEPTNDRLGFGLRLPLGPSAAARERVAEARLELGDARADLGLLRRALDVALHASVHQLALAEDRLRVAEARHALAARNLGLEERAFALGESDLLDRLRIQSRAFEAELALFEARADRQLSLARHNQALGVLP